MTEKYKFIEELYRYYPEKCSVDLALDRAKNYFQK